MSDVLQVAGTKKHSAVRRDELSAMTAAGRKSIPEFVALLAKGSPGERENAAWSLGTQMVWRKEAAAHLMDAGGIPQLLELAKHGSCSGQRREAVVATSHLVKASIPARALVLAAGGVPTLVEAAEAYALSPAAGAAAAIALEYLALEDPERQAVIAEAGGIAPLVEMVTFASPTGREAAAAAVGAVTQHAQANRTSVFFAGGVAPLLQLARVGNSVEQLTAVRTLGNLAAECICIQRELIETEVAIPFFLGLVSRPFLPAAGPAAIVLQHLTCTSTQAVDLVVSGIGDLSGLARRDVSGIADLAGLARSYATDDLGRMAAICTLAHLILYSRHGRMEAIKYDCAPLLVALAHSAKAELKERAAAALSRLAACIASTRKQLLKADVAPCLVELLREENDPSPAVQIWVANAIGHLSEQNAQGQANIAKAGGIKLLVELLESGDAAAKQAATYALCQLSASNRSNQGKIIELGGIPPMASLVQTGTPAAREWAAFALGQLAAGNMSAQCQIAKAGSIPHLVALAGGKDRKGSERAAFALGHLAAHNAVNKVQIVDCGGIQPLVQLMTKNTGMGREWAACTLLHLSREHVGSEECFAAAGGIPMLIELVKSSKPEVQECASSALALLAKRGSKNQQSIAAASGVLPLVDVVRYGKTPVVRECAASALSCVTLNAKSHLDTANGTKPLTDLVRTGTPRARYCAAMTLGHMLEPGYHRDLPRNNLFEGTLLRTQGLPSSTTTALHKKGPFDYTFRPMTFRDGQLASSAR